MIMSPYGEIVEDGSTCGCPGSSIGYPYFSSIIAFRRQFVIWNFVLLVVLRDFLHTTIRDGARDVKKT